MYNPENCLKIILNSLNQIDCKSIRNVISLEIPPKNYNEQVSPTFVVTTFNISYTLILLFDIAHCN